MSEHETHEVIVSICGPVPDWCRCEIVRCMDCKYYDPNDEPSEVYPGRYWCDLMAMYLQPDGFCAWAEMRES